MEPTRSHVSANVIELHLYWIYNVTAALSAIFVSSSAEDRSKGIRQDAFDPSAASVRIFATLASSGTNIDEFKAASDNP